VPISLYTKSSGLNYRPVPFARGLLLKMSANSCSCRCNPTSWVSLEWLTDMKGLTGQKHWWNLDYKRCTILISHINWSKFRWYTFGIDVVQVQFDAFSPLSWPNHLLGTEPPPLVRTNWWTLQVKWKE
jgi:hypothetical protein